MKYVIQVLIFTLIFLDIFARKSWAYIEPGIFNYITQIIIAFLLSMGLMIKIFWSKIIKSITDFKNRRS